MGVLGGWAFSYGRGTPVGLSKPETRNLKPETRNPKQELEARSKEKKERMQQEEKKRRALAALNQVQAPRSAFLKLSSP